MKYSEVIEYINNIPKFTKKNSMNHTQRFMELLGNPDKNIKIIHVAGTNGKGSTCAYMNAILISEGEKVGMFTSPHLIEMTERIQINGQEISKEKFVDAFQLVIKAVKQLEEENLPHPTFFEFLLGMAMTTFALEKATYAILETGLGGRLDATNVFNHPQATVITSIGLDHEAYLGDTIEQIAGEKAGIIKHKIPVIYDGHQEKVAVVIEKKAYEMETKCKKISDSAFEIIEKTDKYIAFYLKDAYDKTITWKIKNRGTFQVTNAVLGLTTLMKIRGREDCHLQLWKEAIENVKWAGRMEEISKGIFLDGAHNVAALEAVAEDMKQVDVLLFSAVSDKNYEEMIKVLTARIKSNAYIVTAIDDSRGVATNELVQLISKEVAEPVYCVETVEEAWNLLKKLKPNDGKALCLGSLYLVGMVKKCCMDMR